jgi:hypothetical protein
MRLNTKMQPSETVGKWKAAAPAERERRENAMIQAEQREWSPTRRRYFRFAFSPHRLAQKAATPLSIPASGQAHILIKRKSDKSDRHQGSSRHHYPVWIFAGRKTSSSFLLAFTAPIHTAATDCFAAGLANDRAMNVVTSALFTQCKDGLGEASRIGCTSGCIPIRSGERRRVCR